MTDFDSLDEAIEWHALNGEMGNVGDVLRAPVERPSLVSTRQTPRNLANRLRLLLHRFTRAASMRCSLPGPRITRTKGDL